MGVVGDGSHESQEMGVTSRRRWESQEMGVTSHRRWESRVDRLESICLSRLSANYNLQLADRLRKVFQVCQHFTHHFTQYTLYLSSQHLLQITMNLQQLFCTIFLQYVTTFPAYRIANNRVCNSNFQNSKNESKNMFLRFKDCKMHLFSHQIGIQNVMKKDASCSLRYSIPRFRISM